MPLFRLSRRLDFPPAWLARSDGLLCIGGDLSRQRLLLAYKNGIFPWFSQDEPILWWSPDPRLILYPGDIHISKSLKKTIRKNQFTLTVDRAFEQVITACAHPRKKGQDGTWLVDEMIEAYIDLHEAGAAHSIETWNGPLLVGGLYGVSLGGCFFGESMFSFESNASKIALVALSNFLDHHGFDIIDCQVTTAHLLSMGAVEIQRNLFLEMIEQSVQRGNFKNIWDSSIKLNPFLEKKETICF